MNEELERIKRERGGRCHNPDCNRDLMGPEQKDFYYCNDCWDANLAHRFLPYKDGCDLCENPPEHRCHDVIWARDYLLSLKKW